MNRRKRVSADNPVLVELGLRSVQATHTFLRKQGIRDPYPQVKDIHLPGVDVWVCQDADDCITGFIGTSEAQIEMLFVDPESFGQGIGTTLLDHARKLQAKLTVDVNEQNPRAHAFYRRYGFEDVGRSSTDSAGGPFPLVHMACAIEPMPCTGQSANASLQIRIMVIRSAVVALFVTAGLSRTSVRVAYDNKARQKI